MAANLDLFVITAYGSVMPNTQGLAPRYTVQSVARAATAVEAVAGAGPSGLTITELGRALGTSKSTAYALARTLVDAGYLRESGVGPRYRLGMTLVRLGDQAQQQMPLADLVRPLLRDLAAETGLTCRVAINDDGSPVFVERIDGPGTVRFHTPLGAREYPSVSSAGKAILAELDEARVRQIIAQVGMPRRTERSLTRIDDLLADLARTRARGWAVDDEEDAPGVFCVGAVVRDRTGHPVGAISATGLRSDGGSGVITAAGDAVRRAADHASKLIGG